MEKYLDYMVEEIVNLAKIPSPTGYSDRAISYLEDFMKKFKVNYSITNKGALVATIDGKNNDMERTISAHVDTLGAMVKNIKGNGRLSFGTLGGYMMSAVEGETCIIETVDGRTYTGTIFTTMPSGHIHGGEAEKLERKLSNMEIIIDERIQSKEDTQKLGIEIGDFVFLDPRTQVTNSGFIKSRHLDDKASVGVLLGIIKNMVENKIVPTYKTNFFFSTYEEVGHGASASVPNNTFEFLAVDMGAPGEGQNSSEFAVCICAKDSSGPYDYEFRKRLVELCKKNNIDYKIDIYPYYGSDAGAVIRSGHDLKTGLIGTGVFASHFYERTHKDGVLNTAKLIMEYVIS